MKKIFRLKASIPLFTAIISLTLMSGKCSRMNPTKSQAWTSDTSNEKPINYNFTGDYKDSWRKVDSLQREGLYKSALQVVDTIYSEANKDNNIPEKVKSVIFRIKLNSYFEEDDYVKALNGLNNEISTAKFPYNQILHSIAAEMFWGYYQGNTYKFINRTQTVNFDNQDISTWDLKTLENIVTYHYIASLSMKDSLFLIESDEFSAIMKSTKEDDDVAPTLYDFLANRAIRHFEQPNYNLTRPEASFSLNNSLFFGNEIEFISVPTKTTDSLSHELYAIRIFQELTKGHMARKNMTALVDISIRRLNFVYNHYQLENKDDLYEKALKLIIEQYADYKEVSHAYYELAVLYNQQAENYLYSNDENIRWKKKEAYELCTKARELYPNSYGALLCESLQINIKQKSIDFTVDEAIPYGEIPKVIVNHKNLLKFHFKLVKTPDDFFIKHAYGGGSLVEQLLKLDTISTWTTTPKFEKDFLQHSTMIALPESLKLEKGSYAIIVSDNESFSVTDNGIAYTNFWVTDLSYNYYRNDDESITLMVNHRANGAPLNGVKVTVSEQEYNYKKRIYERTTVGKYTTNENGTVVIPNAKKYYRNIYIDLEKGDDSYNNNYQIYQYRDYGDNEEVTYTTNFFTDRGIYRPGQTIYFKGICIKHNGDEHTIMKNHKGTVDFYDVNYQKITSMDYTTNEFGSFSGTFTAPQGVLNGSMSIQDNYGSKYFRVEEYKRPKFSAEVEPMEGEYKIGDEIHVKGNAKAYAGYPIDGAKVSYRIRRGASFPFYRWYWGAIMPYSNEIEITNGTTKTDENGEFKIDFLAKEDPSIKNSYYPVYHYYVDVDVTDINGETHTTSSVVAVGNKSLLLSIQIGNTVNKNDRQVYKINTTNLNGKKIAASGKVTINKVKAPEKFYRTANFTWPENVEYTEEEFQKLFPLDAWKNNIQIEDYPIEKMVAELPFNTAKDDSIRLKVNNWEPGIYQFKSVSKDKFGNDVEDIRYITYFDDKSNKIATNDIWWVQPINTTCEPGETAKILLASADSKLKVRFQLEHKGEIIREEWIEVNHEQKIIEIPIIEAYRGNVSYQLIAVKDNRIYDEQGEIYVPFTNKELNLKFETFRNKLLPGAKEEWKLKIKGPKGEKVAAELLATMYDASLDEFAPNDYYLNVFQNYYSNKYLEFRGFQRVNSSLYQSNWNNYSSPIYRKTDRLNWFGFSTYYYQNGYYNYSYGGDYDYDYAISDIAVSEETEMAHDEEQKNDKTVHAKYKVSPNAPTAGKKEVGALEKSGEALYNLTQTAVSGSTIAMDDRTRSEGQKDLGQVKARSNFNETAFFYPQLKTNENSEVIISFTIPEALTKWKFIGLAHTQDLKTGTIYEEVVTQKDLMVQPNAPRFLREGDEIELSAKISNLSDGKISGHAQLFLTDPFTEKPLDGLFSNVKPKVEFTSEKGQSARVSWKIKVPANVQAVKYKIVAAGGKFTDGEENVLPILTNRMLVTESMPLPSKGIGTDVFTFEKLKNNTSTTLTNHKLTLEYTSNPAWYAVQAMPYMMEYPYECAEQTFTRYYSNAIASNLVNSSPKIKQVFEQWKTSDPDAFLSNLEKNQELKSLLLEETPWVLDAQDESERKKRVALLFDLNRMDNELAKAMRKLQKAQVSNGGWPWFPGMPESRYITQHIATGMGHLDRLGVKAVREDSKTWRMVQEAVSYLDERIVEDYEYLKKHYPDDYLKEQFISQIQIQYLYMRSYYTDLPIKGRLLEAVNYYKDQAQKYWLKFGIYPQGMLALSAHRFGMKDFAIKIMKSLKERALIDEEMGMYWKDNVGGYYWYNAPIETQALLIEAFDEVSNDMPSVEEMKIWLLKQKQTTDWKTTKATAEACYALLLRGSDLLTTENTVEIKVAGKEVRPEKTEAGTGYFKTSWSGKEITPEMAKVEVTRKTEGVSWGAMYWQYFENLDKITPHETPLQLTKKLFIVKHTASGDVIEPITENYPLKPGDKVRVRIVLKTDRDLEYVHLKDMRASCFEPVNVLSRYKWQDGLGYYESTKDASTNFFMDYVAKGSYVFEYDLRAEQIGNFSNGISSIQCMYAPEFTSHSEGIRVEVK